MSDQVVTEPLCTCGHLYTEHNDDGVCTHKDGETACTCVTYMRAVTLDEVKALLDKTYELIYVDYRDDLSGSEKQIQEAVQKQDWEPLDGCINDWWLIESEDGALDYIFKENLPGEIVRAYDLEDNDELTADEQAEAIIDQYRQDLTDEIRERDTSNPIKDMIRHTSDPVCFYDLGQDIDECGFDDDMFKDNFRAIKKALGIKARDKTWDKDLNLMLGQASYGGRLVIYFRVPIDWLMDIGDNNRITFKNPVVAIIDTYNGNGDHTDLNGHTFTVPLDTHNIFLDKTIKYSYVYEVCGLIESFADHCIPSVSKTRSKKATRKSSLHAELDVEALYIKAYNEGGCTAGDMDMNRHRDTYYLNEFPCGTHCPHCHTFWID